MIHESEYWKTPLLRAATWLEKLRITEGSAERSLVRVEKELFFGFYAVRKLLDTFEVSDRTKTMIFELKWFPCVGRVDYFNAHRIDELFNLNKINKETRDVQFLCNQFIHSFIFVPVEGEQAQLLGFYICSDRTRHEKLYFIEIQQVLSIFRTVGRDYPTSAIMKRDPNTGQWEGKIG